MSMAGSVVSLVRSFDNPMYGSTGASSARSSVADMVKLYSYTPYICNPPKGRKPASLGATHIFNTGRRLMTWNLTRALFGNCVKVIIGEHKTPWKTQQNNDVCSRKCSPKAPYYVTPMILMKTISVIRNKFVRYAGSGLWFTNSGKIYSIVSERVFYDCTKKELQSRF